MSADKRIINVNAHLLRLKHDTYRVPLNSIIQQTQNGNNYSFLGKNIRIT